VGPLQKSFFVVKSFYNVFFHFPWENVWQIKVPLRVVFFAWSVALGKILIMDILRKQHVVVVDRCCMCERNGEYVNHLLFHCEVVCALWDVFSSQLVD
jgi:hypothetical protein